MPKHVGNLIGKVATATGSGGFGGVGKAIWNLFDQFKFRKDNSWPITISALVATGGNQTPSAGMTPGDGYRYWIFTGPGSLAVTGGNSPADIFVVGGGGGSGGGYSSGGGAGGIALATAEITPNTYPVTVGAGSPGGPPLPYPNTGTNSTFGPGTPVHVIGYGGGTGYTNSNPGGSGNGRASTPTTFGTGIQPTSPNYPTATLYGNPGGSPNGPGGPTTAGGGGAFSAGNGVSGPTGAGPGGSGAPFTDYNSTLVGPVIPAPLRPAFVSAVGPTGKYGGGGGGWGYGEPGLGGDGGGGQGSSYPSSTQTPGINYTGGGGGGSAGEGATTGGTGIVIVRAVT